MKKVNFFLFIFLFATHGFSQINPFYGIYDLDSCKFFGDTKMISFTDSSQTLWQIGKPSKPYFDTAYSKPYAMVTDTINPYPKGVNAYFDLVLLNRIYSNMIVGFKHKYQSDTLKDGGYIEVSYDSGKNWNNVIDDKAVHQPRFFNMKNMYSQKDSLTMNYKGFSGTSDGWIYSQIQWVWLLHLDGIIPEELQLRFHFISDTIGNEKSGWMIDNILVSYADLGSSVKKMKEPNVLHYFPNPLIDESIFKFENLKKEKFTLQLFDNKGILVKTIIEDHPESIVLKRENLSGGLYHFLLQSESGIESKGNLEIE